MTVSKEALACVMDVRVWYFWFPPAYFLPQNNLTLTLHRGLILLLMQNVCDD